MQIHNYNSSADMDFVESDSDEEQKPAGEEGSELTFSSEEIESTTESIMALKAEGNAFFTAGDHDSAVAKYTVCANFKIKRFCIVTGCSVLLFGRIGCDQFGKTV